MRPVVRRSQNEIWADLESLDLDPIKIKLMDETEGEGWTREDADKNEVLYKRFLFLTATSDQVIVPTPEIDAFWHQHILDTRKYASDCDRIFGYFLHHFPYFGMRGDDDAAALANAYTSTCALYQERFGEAYAVSGGKANNCNSCGPSSCGSCSSQCAGSKCSGSVSDIMQTNVRPSL